MRDESALLYRTLGLAVEKAVARGSLTTIEILGALESVKADVLETYAAREDIDMDDDAGPAFSDVPVDEED